MGLAIGTGYYRLASILLGAVLSIQFLLRSGANWIDRRSGLINPQTVYRIAVKFDEAARGSFDSRWSEFRGQGGISIIGAVDKLEGDKTNFFEASFRLSDTRAGEIVHWGEGLARVDGVTSVEWSQKESGGDD